MKMHAEERISRRRAAAQAGLCLGAGVLAVLTAACRRPPPEPLVKAGMYGDSPEELRRLWSNILLACQSDDRNRVHDLLVSLIMTPAELASLIGAQKASELWPRYQAMMGSLCNAGAVELVAHVYEKKYDDVAVTRVEPLPDAANMPSSTATNAATGQTTSQPSEPDAAAGGSGGSAPSLPPAGEAVTAAPAGPPDPDRAVQKALIAPIPFYTVRLKKKTESKGLRYDFFVYRNGFWRTGNLLGKFLVPPAPLPGAAGEPAASATKSPASLP